MPGKATRRTRRRLSVAGMRQEGAASEIWSSKLAAAQSSALALNRRSIGESINIRPYGASEREKWESLVASAEDATTGHLWEWGQIINDAYRFRPFYLVAEDESGSAIAGAPFVWIRSALYGSELTSLPYMDYGGVCHADWLSPQQSTDIDFEIYRAARDLAQSLGAKRVQIRSPQAWGMPFECSTEKVTQHLALCASVDEQRRRLPSERRNRLKKCSQFGLTSETVPVTDTLALAQFYSVYSENMRDLGSPTHSFGFFKSIASHLKGCLKLIMIRHKGQTIASGMAFTFRGTMSLPWTGATIAARPVYGTNAMYWAGISLGIEQRCHTFDFGRSTFGSGIYEFKRQWGPSPVQAYWNTLYLKPGAKSPKQRKELQLASRVWSHLPLALSRMIGPVLRRGISN